MKLMRKKQSGITLIEALVALAVMAIGMLGIVGIQAALRANSDVAKQRSEAVRLAQEKIEEFRGFAQLATATPAALGWADFANGTGTITGNNAQYTRTWAFTAMDAPRDGTTLKVTVSWADRSSSGGDNQSVTLTTALARIAPELATTLAVPGEGDTLRRPIGRQRGIPMAAKDLGNGTSGFLPPGGGSGVVWVFNNATGMIAICPTTASDYSTLTAASIDLTSCTTAKAQLVSGFIRYSLSNAGPSPTDLNWGPNTTLEVKVHRLVPTPATDISCFTDPQSSPEKYTAYFCAVPVSALSWSGNIFFRPNSLISSSLADDNNGRYKACRYNGVAAAYVSQNTPATNQNFLMIKAGNGSHTVFSCPTGTTAHQPDT